MSYRTGIPSNKETFFSPEVDGRNLSEPTKTYAKSQGKQKDLETSRWLVLEESSSQPNFKGNLPSDNFYDSLNLIPSKNRTICANASSTQFSGCTASQSQYQ